MGDGVNGTSAGLVPATAGARGHCCAGASIVPRQTRNLTYQLVSIEPETRTIYARRVPEGSERVDGRKLRYQGRRDELLRAVTKYVLEQGVGQLAIRPMAEAVGVSHATLLNHFGTKENLVTEVVDLLRQQSMPLDAELDIPAGFSVDGAAALESWWVHWTRPEYLPALKLTFEVYGQALLHPEQYTRFLEDVVGGWLDFFARVVTASGCPDDEVEPTATLILASMRGLQLDYVATGDRTRTNAALNMLLAEVRQRQAAWGAAPA